MYETPTSKVLSKVKHVATLQENPYSHSSKTIAKFLNSHNAITNIYSWQMKWTPKESSHEWIRQCKYGKTFPCSIFKLALQLWMQWTTRKGGCLYKQVEDFYWRYATKDYNAKGPDDPLGYLNQDHFH